MDTIYIYIKSMDDIIEDHSNKPNLLNDIKKSNVSYQYAKHFHKTK